MTGHFAQHATPGRADDSPELDWAVRSGSVDAVLAGLAERQRQRRRRRLAGGAAASVAAALLVAGWTLQQAPQVQQAAQRVAPTINIIEPQMLVLPDGSVVRLRDQTDVELRFGKEERRVVLRSGAAHFDVKKDPARPFVVQARDTEVRAVGTAFTVDNAEQSVNVLVTQGTVRVDRTADGEAGALLVDAGRAVAMPQGIDQETLIEEIPVDRLSGADAWRVPRIEFSGSALHEIVDAFNLYSATEIVIADENLQGLRFSGVLRTDRSSELVAMLEANFPVTALHESQRIVLHKK